MDRVWESFFREESARGRRVRVGIEWCFSRGGSLGRFG